MDFKDYLQLITERLTKIEEKLDSIVDKNNNLEVIAAKQEVTLQNQHASLDQHIKRTNLLETNLKKINRHVHWVEGVLKAFGAVSIIAGGIFSIYKFFL